MLRIPDHCDRLIRHHRLILVVALLATVAGAYFSAKLPLKSDLDDLLPDSFASVHAMNRMRQEVGGSGRLRVVLETKDFAAARRFAHDLDQRLMATPYVKYVDYRNNVAFYRRNALLFLDPEALDSLRDGIQHAIDKQKQRLNPLLVDDLFGEPSEDKGGDLASWEEKYKEKEPREYYTNADSTILVVEVFPDQAQSALTFTRTMLRAVQEVVDSLHPTGYASDMQVYYGGNMKNRLDEYEVVRKDILGTALYGITGVFLLIVLYFRSFVAATLISVSLTFSIAWTFGLTYLLIGELNTITGFMFVILFGLGIDYGIHTFARYAESRRLGMDPQQAMQQMVCQTGSAVATTALTTAAAFYLLLLMDFKGFSQLGFIAGTGVLFAFLAMVMVLPALIFPMERWGLLRFTASAPGSGRVIRRPIPHARPIVVAAAVLTVAGVAMSSGLGFEYDFTNLRAISPERQIVSQKTEGVFTLSESPAVVLADSRSEVDAIVTTVKAHKAVDSLTPTIQTVRSIFSLVPDDQPLRLAKIGAIRDLVDREAEGVVTGEDKRRVDRLREYLAVDRPFTWDDVPAEDKRQFLTTKGEIGNFVFIYPSVPLRDGRQAIAFRDDVGTIRTASGKVYYAASSNIISAEMLVLMLKEGKWALGLSVLAVFALVGLDFRNVRASLIVMLPLAIGFTWIGGIMFLDGLKFNIYNIVVLPSIVGIGVDNGVHLYHRYLEEGPGSLRFILRHTGMAISMATLTTIVGYSGLITASHPGLQSIGRLAVIGIGVTFLTGVIVLPAVLQLGENRRPSTAPESVAPESA